MRLLLLTWLLMMPMQHAFGHLLNMTKVELDIEDKHQLAIRFDIDLSAEFGDRKTYFEASQFAEPLQQPQIQNLLARLSESINLNVNGEIHTLDWQYSEFQAEQLRIEDYQDPLTWPSTTIRGVARLPATIDLSKFNVQFTGGFVFEEPIALTINDGEQRMSRWLITMQTSPDFIREKGGADLDLANLNWQQQFNYFYLGFKHILPEGYDHLLFIFLIVLLASSFKQSIWQLSLFTVAHSLTLAISFFGLIYLPPLSVELLIATSIIYLALEVFRQKRSIGLRYPMIFGFGLMHGLGFAAALSEQTLPQYGVLTSLLMFNLGIEAAQIVMALLSVLLLSAVRETYLPRKATDSFFAVVSISLSIYWLMSLLR